jgi:hypothetical protein
MRWAFGTEIAVINSMARSVLVLTMVLTACAQARTLSAPDYNLVPPAVMAEYQAQSRTADEPRAAPIRWLLWRGMDWQVREYPHNATAEHWQRDGGTLFHTKYFHADRRGIAFQSEDLQMIGALPQWQQVLLLISPDVLRALPVRARGVHRAVPWIRHAGRHNGVDWDITLRTDLMLPMKVLRRQGTEIERLVLLSAVPLAQADRQPRTVADYNVLDYTDLGDSERDPFVIKVQNGLGLAPGHRH